MSDYSERIHEKSSITPYISEVYGYVSLKDWFETYMIRI